MVDYNDDYENYGDNPPPVLAASAASSNLEPAISFGLGGKWAVATAADYVKLAFAFFVQGSILVLVLVLIQRCLYQLVSGGPGGGAVVGWWIVI